MTMRRCSIYYIFSINVKKNADSHRKCTPKNVKYYRHLFGYIKEQLAEIIDVSMDCLKRIEALN